MDTDVVSVTDDTLLAELFAPSAESPLPLAVVDGDGRLAGVIPRVTLLETMASVAAVVDSAGIMDVDDEVEAVADPTEVAP